MALSSGLNSVIDGLEVYANNITASSSEAGANRIYPPTQTVVVAGITTNQYDFIWLPALSDVPVGHRIIIVNQSGYACRLRTPASSGEKINNVDCDGTNSYELANGVTTEVIKRSGTGGWIAWGQNTLGAVVTAIVPTNPSGSPSESPSSSISPSASPSRSPSASPSKSPSNSPSASPSNSPSESPSKSPSASPSASESPSKSPSASPSASESPSKSPSASPSASESPSKSPSASPSSSNSPSASPSASQSPSASPSYSPSP